MNHPVSLNLATYTQELNGAAMIWFHLKKTFSLVLRFFTRRSNVVNDENMYWNYSGNSDSGDI